MILVQVIHYVNSFKKGSHIPIRVTAALIQQDNKVLLCRRAPNQKLSGYWEFPGGKVEEGESDCACLQRELLEELGITTEVGTLVAENTHHYDGFSVTLVLLEAKIVSGSLTPTVHDRVEWVPVDSLLDWNLAPADIPLTEKVINLFSAGAAV